MSRWIFAVSLLAAFALAGGDRLGAQEARLPAPTTCRAGGRGPSLDHVIFAVADLDAAVSSFRAQGFTIKPGRAHPDGLLNAHIKFVSAQEVELMSLVGAPGSEIAEEYARILAEGEGGAYLALAAPDLDEVAAAATSAGLGPARPSSVWARFVSFPRDTAAMAVFFGDRSSVVDPVSILTHANGAAGLEEVWVEGGDALARMLVSLGAARCGPVSRGGWRGERFGLANGEVVVVPQQPGRRPRLLGAKLRGTPAGRDWIGVLPPG